MNKIWSCVPGVKYPEDQVECGGTNYATTEELSTAQAAEVLGMCKTTATRAMRKAGIVPRVLRARGGTAPLVWPRAAVYRMASAVRVDELPEGYVLLDEALVLAGVGHAALYRWHDAGLVRTATSEHGFRLEGAPVGKPARVAWHAGDLRAKRAELARREQLKKTLLAGSTLGVQRKGGEA